MDNETLKKAKTLLSTLFTGAELAEIMDRIDPPAGAKRPDKLLTTREACQLAQVHRRTLHDWECRGFLHPRRITPSRLRWSRRELEEFLCLSE